MKALFTAHNSQAHSLVIRHAIIGIFLLLLLLPANALLPGDELLEMQYKTQGLYLINAAVVIFPHAGHLGLCHHQSILKL